MTFPFPIFSPRAATGVQVANSLRFNSPDNAYLSRTPSTASNRKTFTISVWAKRSKLATLMVFLCAGNGANTTETSFYIEAGDKLTFATDTVVQLQTTHVLRDPTAWAHYVAAIDTTQVTAANRIKFYINGVLQTQFVATSYPAQNADLSINNTLQHRVGNFVSASFPFDGYMADFYLIDGLALDAAQFGETDAATGQWNPKAYAGAYGSNGCHLKFDFDGNTVLLLHGDGANGSTVIPDASLRAKGNATVLGNAQISTAQSKFGGASMLFDGAGDYITFPDSADWRMTSDFTLDFWFRLPSTIPSVGVVVAQMTDSSANLVLIGLVTGSTYILLRNASVDNYLNTAVSTTLDTWHHYAVVREGNVWRVYYDGVRVNEQTLPSTVVLDYTGPLEIGGWGTGASYFINAWIEEFRFSRGARYSGASIALPTAPYEDNDSSGMSNLLAYSDVFTAGWVLGNSGVLTAGQADPLGGTGATKLAVGSSTPTPYLVWTTYSFSAGQTTTFSLYVKFGALIKMQLNIGDANGAGYDFNSNGTTAGGASGTGTNAVATMTDAGGGWWKCSVTSKHNTAGIDNIWIAGVGSINGQEIYIFRASLVNGSAVPKELQYTNGAAVANKNWTPLNFSAAPGVGNDVLADSPTNYGATDTGLGGEVRGNYCTMNPLRNAAAVLTNGNLDVAPGTAGWKAVAATWGLTTGKWYWEVLITTVGEVALGVATSDANLLTDYGTANTGLYVWYRIGTIYFPVTQQTPSLVPTFTTGDQLGIALDMDAGKMFVRKNGVFTGDPVAGTGTPAGFTGLPAPLFPSISPHSSCAVSVNFGQRPFANAAPAGYKALCAQNLLAPAIAKPALHFDAAVRAGTGLAGSVTGKAFAPDMIWQHSRAGVFKNTAISYSLLGATRYNVPPFGTLEVTDAQAITSFNADGFSFGNAVILNQSGENFVDWFWKGGAGLGGTGTGGIITPFQNVNPTAGVSVIAYGGNGSAGTITHGLGVAPAFFWIKPRGSAGAGSARPVVWHKGLAANMMLYGDDTGGQLSWTNSITAVPTATVLNLGANYAASSALYAGFVFAEIPGFSKIGSYIGNMVADGPFVWCGFRPKFVLIKRMDGFGSWMIYDAARNGVNVVDKSQQMEGALAEATATAPGDLDFLANGFKVRGTNFNINASGGAFSYIFLAFAETPFQYARAR